MSSLQNFELTISEVSIPNYSGSIKCALVLANFSTTVSIPCKPLNLANVKIDQNDKLYLSIFTQSSEVGCLEIPYTSFSSGCLDSRFRLHENSISPEKERSQLKPTGEITLRILKIEEVCVRCEGLEKLVRDIKVNIDEIEDTSHNHPSKAPQVKDEKKAGIKKQGNKALRSGKGQNIASKQSVQSPSLLQSTSLMQSVSLNPISVSTDMDLKRMLEESYKSRQDLHLTVAETTQQLTLQLKDQRELLENALADRKSAVESANSMQELLKKLEQENQNLKLTLAENEAELEGLRPKVNCSVSYENELNSLTEDLERSIFDNSNLEKKLQESIGSFSTNNTSMNKRIQDLTMDKSDLLGQNEEILKQNHQLRKENDRYANLVNELCGQITMLQAEIESLKARESREKLLMKLLKEEEEAKKLIKKEFDNLSKQFVEQSDKFSKENSRLNNAKAAAESQVLSLQKDLARLESALMSSHKDLDQARAEIATLEQHLCVTEDLNSIIDQLTAQNADLEKAKSNLIEHLNSCQETLEQQDDQLKQQNEKISELETILQERDEQLTSFENIIEGLRKDREIYRPIKDDPIDIALSDYVNTRPANLKVNFDREDHGIYNFGTKKIFVKLEQGKLQIRVGGGFMQVEDFVKLYSPVELERFSSLKKEQAQKMRQNYLGKYADGLATSKSKQELSPERAMKILKDQMASGAYTPYYAVQMKSPERSSNRSPVISEKPSRDSN